MENKEYTLRDLRAEDIFSMLRIINKIGVDEAIGIFNSAGIKEAIEAEKEGGKSAASLADAIGVKIVINLVKLIVSKMPDCEKELYAFLASMSGMKPKDISALPAGTFFNMLVDLFKLEGFKDFFQRAVGLLKLEKSDTSI